MTMDIDQGCFPLEILCFVHKLFSFFSALITASDELQKVIAKALQGQLRMLQVLIDSSTGRSPWLRWPPS